VISPSVSVVVPTHNRSAKLGRLLRSFDEQRTPPLEVIVVDDASSDDTPAVLLQWVAATHAFVAISIRFPANRGPAASRNAGWREATGEIVAFTDDDCIVDYGWIGALQAGLVADMNLGGVGGRVRPLRRDLISRYYTHYKILEPPPSRLYVVTANAAFRRHALDEIGGFSEDLRTPGGEDVEVSLKVRRAGWQLGYIENAVVVHDYRRGLLDFVRTFRAYGRGCRRVTERFVSEVRA
jgi:glycosyltransferase involved in cell wall biosynthesis